MNVQQEWLTLKRCFHHTEGNSNPQKAALYIALSLWALTVVGILFDFVSIDTSEKAAVWSFLATTVGVLMGRVWGKEHVLMKEE